MTSKQGRRTSRYRHPSQCHPQGAHSSGRRISKHPPGPSSDVAAASELKPHSRERQAGSHRRTKHRTPFGVPASRRRLPVNGLSAVSSTGGGVQLTGSGTRSRWWRCGESNPGPSILGRRHLRAQPMDELSGLRIPSANGRRPYSGKSRPRRSGSPAGPILLSDVRGKGQEPFQRTGRLSSGGQRHWSVGTYSCYRLFNEDSGDLGSLPTLQRSTSKPDHPQRVVCRLLL